jgi:hypothetical protein
LQVRVCAGVGWGSRGFTAGQNVFDGGVGKEILEVRANVGLEGGGGVKFNAFEEGGEEPLGVKDRGNFGHDGGMGKRCVRQNYISIGKTINDITKIYCTFEWTENGTTCVQVGNKSLGPNNYELVIGQQSPSRSLTYDI